MKEKTSDIDILEDLLSTQKQYIEDKDYQKEHNIKEQAIDYAKMWTKATENLIAENKELKDSNVELATTIDCLQTDLKEIKEEYSAEQKYEMENTIPKSKLKAKIEEVEQGGLYNMKIPKLSTLDERLGAKIGIKYVLQSLLGKE